MRWPQIANESRKKNILIKIVTAASFPEYKKVLVVIERYRERLNIIGWRKKTGRRKKE